MRVGRAAAFDGPHDVTDDLDLASKTIPLDADLFLRRMLRELSGTLEDVVGIEAAEGFVNSVGSAMGRWIGECYGNVLKIERLDPSQLAQVFVDLKRRINGGFYVIDIDEDRIILGNNKCPFGEMAKGRMSLCMMTSNVFGRIAADNLGYARVELEETIAGGSDGCRIVVWLKEVAGADPTGREYYAVPAGNGLAAE